MRESDNGASGKSLDYAELKEPEPRLSRVAPLPKEPGQGSGETVSKAKYDIIRDQLRKTQVREGEREGGERERGKREGERKEGGREGGGGKEGGGGREEREDKR